VELRDPKLSVTPDGRLMILAGGSVYDCGKLIGRQPRVAFSRNGLDWTPTQRILSEGEWLWRVTWHQGRAYGVSYNTAPGDGKDNDWSVKLLVSRDGIEYEQITVLDIPGRPNETTLRFLNSREMMALVRREGGNMQGWIGVSRPPYYWALPSQWNGALTRRERGLAGAVRLKALSGKPR